MKHVAIKEIDNRREWKEKEFNRLFPNSLFSSFERFAWHFYPCGFELDFDLRKFKKEYKSQQHES